MKRTVSALFFLLMLAIATAACRQPDGPVPVPDADDSGDIGDVSKDLMNVTSKNPDAPKELADDLVRFASEKKVEPPASELGRRVSDVVVGSKLTPPDAQKLATLLWTVVAAEELSERQAEALGEDVKEVLVKAGVAEDRTEPILAQVQEVQKVVTTRKRRWYEVF